MNQVPTSKLAIVIPARLASTRIPRKPLLTIDGKTLVEHVVEMAKLSRNKDCIVVTSESDRVLDTLKHEYNIQCIKTSDQPLTGTERVAELLDYVDSEYYLLLPCDIFPVRSMTLDHIFESALSTSENIGCLVAAIQQHDLSSDDAVKMLLDSRNYARNFVRNIPADVFTRYRIGSRLVKQLGVYIYSKSALQRYKAQQYDLLEVMYNNESYRLIHHIDRMKAIFTTDELFSIHCPKDILKIKEAGYDVQYAS